MVIINFLAIYLIICMITTLLLTRFFSVTKPLPDRRHCDRRKKTRSGHLDRRVAYRGVLYSHHFSQQ